AAILSLDILENEGEQKQSELFERVARETSLKIGTVKRKVYWGILQEEGLVESRKDGFEGGWLISRSDRERPKGLRSVTSNRNLSPNTEVRGHTSSVLPSMANYDPDTTLSHISSNTVPTMTYDFVSEDQVMLGGS